MSKSKKVNMLVHKKACPVCKIPLPALPPCPKCGTEIPNFMDMEQYSEIMDFLQRHKGSQCRVMLGKKDGEQILVYELLTKSQIKES